MTRMARLDAHLAKNGVDFRRVADLENPNSMEQTYSRKGAVAWPQPRGVTLCWGVWAVVVARLERCRRERQASEWRACRLKLRRHRHRYRGSAGHQPRWPC